MVNVLKIPENCVLDRLIAVNRFLAGISDGFSDMVESVLWNGTLKPGFAEVSAVKTESIRYEEIQIFTITITKAENIYPLARAIYRKIKYPCLLVLEFRDKFLLSCCPFRAGKLNYDDNILRAVVFSHWLHPDFMSRQAAKVVEDINKAIADGGDFLSMYRKIQSAIENYPLSGTSKAHVDRLLHHMLINVSPERRDKIMYSCTPYRKYFPADDSMAARYDKSRRTSNYHCIYDYEDIWYCLNQYEPTRRVIDGRRYRDIQDLIFSIDSKYYEE